MKNKISSAPALLIGAAFIFFSCGYTARYPDPKKELPPDYPSPAAGLHPEWENLSGSYSGQIIRQGSEFPAVRFISINSISHLSPLLWSGSSFPQSLSREGRFFDDDSWVLDSLGDAIIVEAPKFLIVTGGLTFRGSMESHYEAAGILREISLAGIPVFVLPGKEDISNPGASRYSNGISEPVVSPSLDEFKNIYGEFGYSAALNRAPLTFSYLVEPVDGLWILVLDIVTGGSCPIPELQMNWISEVLEHAKAEDKAVLVFLNHSILEHSMESGGAGKIPEQSLSLINLFFRFNVPAVFSADPVQDTAAWKGGEGEWFYEFTSGPVSLFPHSYRIVDIDDIQFMNLKSARLPSPASWSLDHSFYTYSRNIMLESIVDRIMPLLADKYNVSRYRAGLMAEYIAVLKLNRIAGEEQGALPDNIYSRSRFVWANTAPNDFSKMIQQAGFDSKPEDNRIQVDLVSGRWRSLDE